MRLRPPTALLLVGALAIPGPAFAEADDTLLISRAAGAQGAKARYSHPLFASSASSISADGRFVVFESGAHNLVRGAGTNPGEVYVRDLRTNRVEVVSRRSGKNGSTGDEGSGGGAVSGDGRFVAFDGGRDLHPDSPRDYGPVLVRDRKRQRTLLASRASGARGATANHASGGAALSHDGRFVAFESNASNLHHADRDHRSDVFVRDMKRNRTLLASGGNGSSGNATISADGRYVAFTSTATDLHPHDLDSARDVYVRDLKTGEVTLVSRGPGLDGIKGDGESIQPWISADGRFVTFVFRRGSNMLPDDTDRTRDVYLRDLVMGTTVLVSRGPDGKSNGSSDEPTISADGRFVAFESSATNLDPADTDSAWDVYVRDVTAGTTRLVSRASGATGAKAAHPERLLTGNSIIAADGRSIVFDSNAVNLHPHDRDDEDDVYVRELRVP